MFVRVCMGYVPAVTKTRSAPLTISVMASRLSSAALAPTSGLPPAPRPLYTSMQSNHYEIMEQCNNESEWALRRISQLVL